MSATPIDLSQLPVPDIVELIDYETLLAQRKARLVSLYPAEEQTEVAATLELESEPMVKLLQENAYREVVLRQRVNDAARAVMLAYAENGDLEQLAAFFDLERLTITPADPVHGTAAVMESDSDLRYRTQLAPSSLSVAGPESAYIKHARDADGRVLDATAASPSPCQVLVTVLSRIGDGSVQDGDGILDAVRDALSKDDVRPLTDEVLVQGAQINGYAIDATLIFFAGPDRSVVLAQANKAVKKYTDDMHRLGMEITRDGIFAAARQPGVQKVILRAPAADMPSTKQQAPFCTGINLLDGGVYSNE
ncbi:baseplate J/gp47 family protein [Paraburkholderia acidipaludis]|uniref:baseplate J/gp47 family protein n=1 Tax=Paraburkholderia acidipaludis TaxID=660537 RepID=UPI000488AF6B|nr:baseplate J/gp47 family protein [Paraburkholderia acidipaludis]